VLLCSGRINVYFHALPKCPCQFQRHCKRPGTKKRRRRPERNRMHKVFRSLTRCEAFYSNIHADPHTRARDRWVAICTGLEFFRECLKSVCGELVKSRKAGTRVRDFGERAGRPFSLGIWPRRNKCFPRPRKVSLTEYIR
jgi:hypothetical protein